MGKRSLLLLAFGFGLFACTAQASSLIRISENAVVKAGAEFQDIIVINGSADIGGRILGNILVISGKVTIRNGAYVGGDIVCLGGEITAGPGALISGSKVEIGGKINWKSLPFFSIAKVMLLSFLYKISSALILLLLSVFMVFMLPNQIRYAAEEASSDLVKSTLVGVFSIALLIPLAVGFAITLFGLPIALALSIFLLVVSWFGIASMSYLVGHKISSHFSPVMSVVVGLIVLKFIHFVPFIGGMLYFIAILPGLGAILLTRFGTNKPWLGSSRNRPPKPKA